MKRFLIIISCLLAFLNVTLGQQKTTIVIRTDSKELQSINLFSPNYREIYLHEKGDWFWSLDVLLDEKGVGSSNLEILHPTFMTMSVPRQPNYDLFITPGDRLEVTIHTVGEKKIEVKGKGHENNQQINIAKRYGYDGYQNDTLPGRLLFDLHAQYERDSTALSRYIEIHHPSQAFVEAQWENLRYLEATSFYSFVGNHKYMLRKMPNGEALFRLWKTAVDSVLATVDLDNELALVTPNFTNLVRGFLLRKKEELWEQAHNDRASFANEWYGADEGLAMKQYEEDPQNLLTEKIINRYFSGATAAFAYANLLHNAVGSKEDNLPAIYGRFAAASPGNSYLPFLETDMDKIRIKEKNELTEKMILVQNSDTLNTFEQVLALVKNKTVLLDMWGTWCEPCREEIDKHSGALKAYFKDKGLEFLYISNYDLGKEDQWKKLIAYYSLEGIHILAKPNLSSDIMSKVKGEGYPTYVIFKKDGSFELSTAGYPLDREKLIKQIEAAL